MENETGAAAPFHIISRIVVPGEVVFEKPVRAAYTYTDGTQTFATVMSLLSDDGKLIPLEGPYEPLVDDVVVGFVSEVRFDGYAIDIGSPFHGRLSGRDSRDTFALGDIVQVRIISVDEVKDIDFADGRKLAGGVIERISPVKVPRLIGKKNSMINMIANASGCPIAVGRNGLIFVSQKGDHALAKKAIAMIEAQAHTSGLTDRMAAMLSAATGKNVQPMADEHSSGGFGAGSAGGFGSEGGAPPGGSSQGGYGGRGGGFRGGDRGGGRPFRGGRGPPQRR